MLESGNGRAGRTRFRRINTCRGDSGERGDATGTDCGARRGAVRAFAAAPGLCQRVQTEAAQDACRRTRVGGAQDAWRVLLPLGAGAGLAQIEHLVWDARYEKIRVGGSVVSCALLVAVGITPDGRRTIVGLSVSLSEAEVHWREFLASLQERGMHGVRLIVSDDHQGLAAARTARFPGVPADSTPIAEPLGVPPIAQYESLTGPTRFHGFLDNFPRFDRGFLEGYMISIAGG